jgi:signal transduction histidine kinase/CheY-like chemotaxis protein
MKVLSAAFAVLVLITLLTWLSMQSFNTDAERFDRALAELDRFSTAVAMLNSNVLSARSGLLRNYDPLVADTDALDASLGHLQQIMAGNTAAESAIHSLVISADRQEVLIEQFKSENALLQNSLAYFALSSSILSSREHDAPLASAISALAISMLRLDFDTNMASAHAVQDRLDELARQIPYLVDAAPAATLLAHGRLLHELLPATDGILRALGSVPLKRDQEVVRALLLQQQYASREAARQFRFLLYMTSLLLVGLLAYVGLQLRSRVRAIRRRTAFERVLAGISLRFINTRETDLNSIVAQALAEMARCVGADRAYVLTMGSSEQSYTWCRQGVLFPPGWPERVPLLLRYRFPSFDGVVHVPRTARLPPGEARDAIAAVGVDGWACVTGRGPNGAGVLLGFDAVTHASRIMPAGELGLLRTALDTIVNVIGRRSLEQERTRIEARLEQTRRLETVGTLASGIAHNFNNIVGAILGYVELADEQEGPSPIHREIRRAGERARELVDQILNFARRRDVRRDPMDVRRLIAEAASLLRAALPAEVELAILETEELILVSGVQAQLQQVILNLCNNAAQAMDHMGSVELEVAPVELSTQRSLSHGVLAAGRYVRIAVSDSGRGIDPATQARLFEPFFTTRLNGNGLGLTTTRDIVREHGGAMHVQSVAGVGSRFEVWLPRVDAEPLLPDGAPRFGNGETVMVMEVDPQRLLRDEEVLAALGYEPVGFNSGADARAACEAASERFDLILLGHLFPATAMLELATVLHDLAPAVPILLATSSADEFRANELVRAGVSDIVPWPITAGDIAVSLGDCLRRSATRGIERSAPRTDITAATRASSDAIVL